MFVSLIHMQKKLQHTGHTETICRLSSIKQGIRRLLNVKTAAELMVAKQLTLSISRSKLRTSMNTWLFANFMWLSKCHPVTYEYVILCCIDLGKN